MRTQATLAALSLLGLAFAPATATAATLRLLPPHTDQAFDFAVGIAADGTVAGNTLDIWGSAPALWPKAGDTYLPPLSPALPSGALGGELRWLSADAAFIAGYAALPLTDADEENHVPVLWVRSGGTASYAAAALPRLGVGASQTLLTGGASDASRLVGQSGPAPSAALWRGGPWTAYSVQALPLPPDAAGASIATALSDDGTRAVGHCETRAGSQALLWTEGVGGYAVTTLAPLPGGARAFAEIVSRDGLLAAGAADDASGLRPVVWDTRDGGATPLETPPGHEATVLALSANNAWLGGRATHAGSYESVAVLWDRSGKHRGLAALAVSAGIDLDGLVPESVTGIRHVSDNLYAIVGTGLAKDGLTHAFVLENLALATPATTPGDDDPEGGDPAPDTPDDPAHTGAPASSGGVFLKRHTRADDTGKDTRGPTIDAERPLGRSSRKRPL